MSDIKIVAKSVEEFNEISDALKSLPSQITDQIEKAEKGIVGITCELKSVYGKSDTPIYLLNNTKQIIDFDDYIGVYSDKFFFKIGGDLKKQKIKYEFVDVKS